MISDVLSLPFLVYPHSKGLEWGGSVGSGGRKIWFEALLYEATGCVSLDMSCDHLQ